MSRVAVVRRADFIRFFLVTAAFGACILLAAFAPGDQSGGREQAIVEISSENGSRDQSAIPFTS